jgi:hypothetical protein
MHVIDSQVWVLGSARVELNEAGDHAGAVYGQDSSVWLDGAVSVSRNFAGDDGVSC